MIRPSYYIDQDDNYDKIIYHVSCKNNKTYGITKCFHKEQNVLFEIRTWRNDILYGIRINFDIL